MPPCAAPDAGTEHHPAGERERGRREEDRRAGEGGREREEEREGERERGEGEREGERGGREGGRERKGKQKGDCICSTCNYM